MSFAALGDHLAIALPGGTALFTTRRGGVSDGPFASLNLGLWTDDDEMRVRENRARVERIGGGPIGPGAGPCCYEVGDEVRAAFGTSGRTVDLKAIARERLADAGVETIHDCGLCTMHDPERFFSHRRDGGVTGRQAGLAWRS